MMAATLPRSVAMLQLRMAGMGLTEFQSMNYLQEHGLISDNCILWCDVAEVDAEKAMDHLRAASAPAQQEELL